ncbi:hypothetical protein ACO0LV_12395, partial [Pseudactinotalea sp. Z1739]|uniref:hypothetical protein n=1 Tax=Pseudactinotalea sp. Z1739 TaxID=3413028 RepID=UPI003C7CFE1C
MDRSRRAQRARPVPRTIWIWAITLFLIDLVLMLGFVAHIAARRYDALGFFSYWRWHGEQDRSFLEILGATQLVAAAVLLLILTRRRTQASVYSAWALLFVVMAVDDLAELHERGSRYL